MRRRTSSVGLVAVVIVVAILSFMAAEVAGQALFSRDAPKRTSR